MNINPEALLPYARKYVWWKTPEDAVAYPQKVIAQVMNIGEYDDVLTLTDLVGEAALRGVIQTAEIGQFSPKSWHFWHYRLNLAELDCVPPLPVRRVE
jgi:hypothetical protein